MLLYRKSTQGETARCAPPSKPQSAVALARVDGVMPSALPLSVSCAHAAHPCRGLGFACGALAPMRITFVVCPLCVLPFPEVRHKQNQDNSAPAPALWKWAEAILVLGPRSCFPLYSLPGLTPQNKRVTMITATGARLALLCAIAIGALAAAVPPSPTTHTRTHPLPAAQFAAILQGITLPVCGCTRNEAQLSCISDAQVVSGDGAC